MCRSLLKLYHNLLSFDYPDKNEGKVNEMALKKSDIQRNQIKTEYLNQ